MIPIVVVAWNHLETTTRPCLESIFRFTDVDYRVVAVDNASDDGTRRYLEETAARDRRVEPVFSDKNLGWAGGTLLGLERVVADDDPICLLNSDTIVTPGWLSRLSGHLPAHPGATLVIPSESADPEAPRPAAPGRPADMTPGTASPPAAADLDEVLRIAADLAVRNRGKSRPAPPSGFCLLTRKERLGLLARYLREFDRFRSGDLSWPDFMAAHGVVCRVALDTYVFHARGGSGAYYVYGRSRDR